MKPLQVGILMAAAALAGGLFMTWQRSRPAPTPAPVSTAAPATVPQAAPAPTAAPAQAAEPLPSPFAAERPRKAAESAKKPHAARSAEPKTVAANQPAAGPRPETAAAAAAPAAQPEPPAVSPAPAARPEPETVVPPPPPPPRQVTLTAGTLVPVRTVEGLSSDRNQVGDTFTATLDQPLVVDGFVIAERGARLEGRVVQSQKAGRVKGLSDLDIELTQLSTSDGQRVPLETETFEKHGESSVRGDAAKVGAAAGIGAAIGAIAGGGKGAAIGAAVGGAAGTGGVMATRGKPAVLPAETRINFRLRNSVTITERQRK